MVKHYNDVIMSAMMSHITSLSIVYSTVYSGTDQRKHQSPASLAFVRGIHRWPGNSPRKGPVTRKMFPFDDVIMKWHEEHFLQWWYANFDRMFYSALCMVFNWCKAIIYACFHFEMNFVNTYYLIILVLQLRSQCMQLKALAYIYLF